MYRHTVSHSCWIGFTVYVLICVISAAHSIVVFISQMRLWYGGFIDLRS